MGDCGMPNECNSTIRSTIPIKAVIFDLDGTLLDTETLSDKAMFGAFGDSLPSDVREKIREGDKLPWEIKKQILGLRGSEWIPMVIKYAQEHWSVSTAQDDNEMDVDKKGDVIVEDEKSSLKLPPPPPVNDFWNEWETNLNSMCQDIEACSGATELVCQLHKHKVPLAIATSSRQVAVSKKRMRHEDIFQHIPIIVTGDDPAVKNGKPAPDIYLEAARRLGVDPSECLVVEDAMTGVKAGKAAGCYVVAVPDPRMDKSMFASAADVVLDDLWHFDGEPWGIPVKMLNLKLAPNKQRT